MIEFTPINLSTDNGVTIYKIWLVSSAALTKPKNKNNSSIENF